MPTPETSAFPTPTVRQWQRESQRSLVIEVLLDGEVVATGTLSSEICDLSKSVGMPLVPAMLRKIADKWEATDRLENDRRKS